MRTIQTSVAFLVYILLFLALGVAPCVAELVERQVEYKEGSSILKGFIVEDVGQKVELPGVIIFSDWMGVGDFARARARELAKDGYRAFVADIYGNGKQAKDSTEAGELATKFKTDRVLMRKRAEAAFHAFLSQAKVDETKVAAIGFCFGGTVALELARNGTPLRGLVSFHGGLSTPDTSLARKISGQVLVLHGADDPLVPQEEVLGFEKEMRDAQVNWELVSYGKAVHSFTNPQAGDDPSKGFAYNEPIAIRAYARMREFFTEIFG